MKYCQIIKLKNGMECCIRNGSEGDGQAVLDNFNLTHGETDYLLTYPDETGFNAEQEGRYLQKKADSKNEIELLAVVGDTVVGTAGIEAVGTKYKVRHRAEVGVSVAKEFWGVGVGRALLEACIECARAAGYAQIELEAVAENARALAMYEQVGFVEYGRNPRGFRSRVSGWQELVYMRLALHEEKERLLNAK